MTPLSPTEYQVMHELFMEGPVPTAFMERRVRLQHGWRMRPILKDLESRGLVLMAPLNQMLRWATKSKAAFILRENDFGIMEPYLEIREHCMDADYQGLEDMLMEHRDAVYNFLHSKCRETWDVTPAGVNAIRITKLKQQLK